MIIKKISGDEWVPNCYIIHNDSEAIIIDPGCDYKLIQDVLGSRHLIAILATHGHYDHILHVSRLQRDYHAAFFLHRGDEKLIKHANFYLKLFHGKKTIEIPTVDNFINDEEFLDFGFTMMKVIYTPGHTEGSVCYLVDNNLFSGDLLMKGTVGRTDLPGGSVEKLSNSIKKLTDTFKDVNVLPGHFEDTTLGNEKQNNRKLMKILDRT